MTLLQLQYFKAVCDCDYSITRASEKLHVTKPCISTAIKELEEEYSLILFERNKRKLKLTNAGYEFLQSTSSILRHTQSLTDRMVKLVEQKSWVRIGISPFLGHLLPDITEQFIIHEKNSFVDIYEMMTEDLLECLTNHSIDFAITNIETNSVRRALSNRQGSSFEIVSLHIVEQQCFCTWSEHPLAKHSTITLKQIHDSQEPLMMIRPNVSNNKFKMYYFDQKDLEPNLMLFCNHITTLYHHIKTHKASAIIAQHSFSGLGGIKEIPISDLPPKSIGIIKLKDKFLSGTAQTIIDTLLSVQPCQNGP